jgi:cystathionine beta-lyase/cystathionine gamma-synthase
MEKQKNIDYILTHLGEERENYFSAISPPIIQSSNFQFHDVNQFREYIVNEETRHVYTRGNNPTVSILCKKLAALERTERALVTSSGAAAISCAVVAQVKAGDHVICVQKPYSWTYRLLVDLLAKFNVSVDFVDGRNILEIEAAVKSNTTLLYLESPNSMTFEIQDLEACAQLAQKHDLVTIIDNSYSSPLYQNPADYGIDIVVHSGTKYINGHSDVVVGVICGSEDHISKIFHGPYMTFGVNISPNDAWLVIRGLRTLPLRMQRCTDSALEIMSFLRKQQQVKAIIHPHADDFPQVKLAKKQMKACGGLFTMILNADSKESVLKFVHGLKRFLLAVSWGGHESLIMPSIVFHDIPGKEDSIVPWTYVRFYIGLESPEYLIDDLKQALSLM